MSWVRLCINGGTYDARGVKFPEVGVYGFVVWASVVVRVVGDGACRCASHLDKVVASRKGSVGLAI